MSLDIFVSHSFDHADKLLGVLRFIRDRGIEHVDHSVPAWDPYNGPDVQAEIERRVRRCDRVVVVLTKGIHQSPWIKAEVEWARKYHKPIIAVWPHGEAGEPIPEVVAESAPHLIGWRATSLEKALKLEEVGNYRAIDLAEDADREQAIARVVQGAGVASLLLVGADLVNLKRVRDRLRARGYQVSFNQDQTSLLIKAFFGLGLGGLLGHLLGDLFGKTKDLPRQLAIGGALLGGGLALHQHLKAEIRALGPLSQMDLAPRVP